MKIVIDIEEERYNQIKRCADNFLVGALERAVKNGTPLPKGHGRLIDADALMKYCQNDINKTVDCNDISRFPTIIRREE